MEFKLFSSKLTISVNIPAFKKGVFLFFYNILLCLSCKVDTFLNLEYMNLVVLELHCKVFEAILKWFFEVTNHRNKLHNKISHLLENLDAIFYFPDSSLEV